MDPAAGPVPRFALELRELRRKAGGPTYRTMAEKAGYSVTALSQAAAGQHFPTLPLTLAYVRACGADPQEWEQRWLRTFEEIARSRPDDAADAPYRGLARFEPRDAALFFGRDRLADRIARLARRHRFTAVFGSSGSGKSSLLRAGLIPRLRQPEDGAPRPAAVRILTPGEHPLRSHGPRLAAPPGADGDTWLIVDQFEELHTLCRDPAERAAFVDRLLAARDPGSGLRVVIAVRADFLHRCTEHAGLTAALQDATVLAGPMGREELREAIVKPAQAAGYVVERSLTSRLLDEVEGEPGTLPLLSHALLETWRHRRGRTLNEAAYEAAGGLRGAIARTAEGVHARFTAPQADLARRILLRLVAPGDGAADTRRPAARGELDLGDPRDAARVVESLARARLLVLDEGTVDLAHEALITAWPRLRGWIDAERDRMRTHRRLTDDARAWQDLGRDPGALYRGSRLAAAVEAFPAPDRDRDLTPPEREFLAASTRQRHRAVRLRRTVTAVLAALVLVASGTAVVAFQQRASARAERNAVLHGQVTSRADSLRSTQTSLAAQLDLAAHRMRPTPDLYTRLVGDAGTALSTPLAGHRDIVASVAYSPDGRTLASGGHDGTVRLWNTGGPGRPRGVGAPLADHSGPVASVAFAPDGRTLATGGHDHTVRLWDVRDPARPRRLGAPLADHSGPVVSVAFGPDGRTLATGGDDGVVRLWDVDAPARPHRLGPPLADHSGGVRSVAFSRDGRTLATSGFDRTVRLWDVGDPGRPRRLGEPLRDHTEPVWSVAFSPDGRTLATAGFDRTVRLWDVGDPGRPRRLGEPLRDHTEPVWSVAFSPDGRTLASAGRDDTVRLWNLTNPAYPKPLGPPLTDHTDGVWTVAFHPDGRTLATGGYDRSVRVWHLPGTLLTGYTNPVTAVAFAPGDVLATASTDDRAVRLWRARNPARPVLLAKLVGHDASVTAVAFSSDGRTLATGSADRTAKLWNVRDPARPVPLGPPLAGHRDGVTAVAFGRGGRLLATGGKDGTARLWDIADPARPAPLGVPRARHRDQVLSVAFHRDGRLLATGGEDNTARLWDIADPARPAPLGAPLADHRHFVNAVAFAPDGRTLAIGDADRKVRLWDITRPARPTPLGPPLTGHKGAVTAVAFSPDGRTLATAGSDHTARLWNLTDRARPAALGQPLTGHGDTVTSVAFSRDGRTLATSSYDVSVRLWHLDADRAARRICAAGNLLTPRQWRRHLPHVPFHPPCG
ncbi:hypothetical protein GCM10027168_57400 [Streptomyces capparidis]